MTPDFIQAVTQMRQIQKAYFKARRQNDPACATILEQSKRAEKIVDDMLAEINQPIINSQPNLFS